MIVSIQGWNESAISTANGFGKLWSELPVDLKLAEMDQPMEMVSPKTIIVIAFSHGMDLAMKLFEKNPNQRFAVAACDPVKHDSWFNPFRADYVLPPNVIAGRCWTRNAWMPPFSSKCRSATIEVQNSSVWAGHTGVICKIVPDVTDFTRVFA